MICTEGTQEDSSMNGIAVTFLAMVIYFSVLMLIGLVGYINADRLEGWVDRKFSKKKPYGRKG